VPDELAGKTALVTGGARGFGRAIARLFAQEGADVAIADIAGELPSEHFPGFADREDLERTVVEIEALDRRTLGIQADVARADDCRRMVHETLRSFGRIDILCANAGIFSFGKAWELTEDEWDTLMAVNLKGVWLSTRAVVPHMMERRYGKIVITSSRDGLRAEPNYSHYCASKFGVIGYMKSLAIELGPYGINVNAICPTQMTDRSGAPPRPAEPPQYWRMVTGTENPTYEEFDLASGKENLFEAGGQADFSEVAEGVLWLASDRSRLVTGHALPLDAGWIAKRGG
jgi:NAD(P)-dependent dehydrogenase (short-subunit alcohol dehydrogenase family)